MIKKFLILLVVSAMLTTASCGTLIKNGKGGRSNQLDVSIVILDTVGLLFFAIPGLVAFVVDFNNKTIYK